jgi:hypothetical protein
MGTDRQTGVGAARNVRRGNGYATLPYALSGDLSGERAHDRPAGERGNAPAQPRAKAKSGAGAPR